MCLLVLRQCCYVINQFFLELIATQLRFHMVSLQLVLLIILTMQSYKFYLINHCLFVFVLRSMLLNIWTMKNLPSFLVSDWTTQWWRQHRQVRPDGRFTINSDLSCQKRLGTSGIWKKPPSTRALSTAASSRGYSSCSEHASRQLPIQRKQLKRLVIKMYLFCQRGAPH